MVMRRKKLNETMVLVWGLETINGEVIYSEPRMGIEPTTC